MSWERKDLTFSAALGYHTPTVEQFYAAVMGPLEDFVYIKRC
jgi:hypothetical protein